MTAPAPPLDPQFEPTAIMPILEFAGIAVVAPRSPVWLVYRVPVSALHGVLAPVSWVPDDSAVPDGAIQTWIVSPLAPTALSMRQVIDPTVRATNVV